MVWAPIAISLDNLNKKTTKVEETLVGPLGTFPQVVGDSFVCIRAVRAGFLDFHGFVLVQVIVESCVSSEDVRSYAEVLFVEFVDVFGELVSPHQFEEGVGLLASFVFPYLVGSVFDGRLDAASRDWELYRGGF